MSEPKTTSQEKVKTATTVTTAQETAAPAVIPKEPEGASMEEIQGLKEKCEALVNEIFDEAGSRAVLTKFDNLGEKQRETLSSNISLLKHRLSKDLELATAEETPTAKNLSELNVQLTLLNPKKIREEKIWGFLPMSAKKALIRLKERAPSAQEQINRVLNSLRESKEELVKDNIELEQLGMNVDKARIQVLEQAYLGELLIQAIEKRIVGMEESRELKNIEKLRHRLYVRVQDLRITEQVDLQFEAGISTMLDNNLELKDAITRTTNVAEPLLTVIMSLAVARQRQKAIRKSTQATRQAIGDLLVAGSEEQLEASKEIAALANDPVVALNKVEESYENYMKAMEETSSARQKGIESAKHVIEQTKAMSSKLETEVKQFRNDNPLELEDSKN